MKRLFLLLVFTTSILNAQYVVKVADHEIAVDDTIAKNTLEEFFEVADRHRVDYLTTLKGIKAVRTFDGYKTTIARLENGVLYVNSYANKYPLTKRIIILHLIGKYYGLKPTQGSSYKVMNEHFILNDKTEYYYRNRKTLYLDMKDLIGQLEEKNPLNTKIR